MKLTPWYIAAFMPIAVAGCSGTFLGHFAVLGVTLCIFYGTLTLGRHAGTPGTVDEPVAGSGDATATASAPQGDRATRTRRTS